MANQLDHVHPYKSNKLNRKTQQHMTLDQYKSKWLQLILYILYILKYFDFPKFWVYSILIKQVYLLITIHKFVSIAFNKCVCVYWIINWMIYTIIFCEEYPRVYHSIDDDVLVL